MWGVQSNKLLKLQKKAVRTISKCKYNAHTDPLFKKLKILKIHDLCALHDMKFCFKFGNDLLPKYFTSKLFLRYQNPINRSLRHMYTLPLPAVRHEFARNSISYKFPKTFNNMALAIKEKIDTHSFDGFKNYAKNSFFSTYDENCHIINCYICQN